jgi:hypothetical protein
MWTFIAFLLSAHVHGEANISVTIEKEQLKIEFSLPGDEIPGLKKRPQNESDLKIFDAQLTQEAEGQHWFSVSPPSCIRKSIQVKTRSSGSTGHFDYHLEMIFNCASDVEKAQLYLEFWKKLPAIKKLRALILKEEGQRSVVLKPGDSKLYLK